MVTFTDSSKNSSQRCEHRKSARVFVEVKPIGEQDDSKVDALTSDVSESGVALISYLPFPVGTQVTIKIPGGHVATGEVIDVDHWDCCGLARMGVQFIEKKENWPLH